MASRIADKNGKTPIEIIDQFERFMATVAESVTELDEEEMEDDDA